MAAKLLATAGKFSPGQDRHSALQEVGRFRARIAALMRHPSWREHPRLKAKAE
jgi:hypothetical protein